MTLSRAYRRYALDDSHTTLQHDKLAGVDMKMTDAFSGAGHSLMPMSDAIVSLSTEAAAGRSKSLRISLKQWKMFNAVIDFDGFLEAAENLHVTQSTVSHAIAKLQEQLGVSLLELKGRKAHITEEGKILLERSRDLVKRAIELEELADNLREGWGPEIRLAIDSSFPADLLTLALQRSSIARGIRLRVNEATPEKAIQALSDNTVDLAISKQVAFGFVGKELIEIEHIAVTHPSNPLFALKRELTPQDLHTQCQIVISDSNDYFLSETDRHFPRHPQPWRVSSLDRAINVLRKGFGYAWLPRHQVQERIDGSQVRILPVADGSSYKTPLFLNVGRPLSADSAIHDFAEALHDCSVRYF